MIPLQQPTLDGLLAQQRQRLGIPDDQNPTAAPGQPTLDALATPSLNLQTPNVGLPGAPPSVLPDFLTMPSVAPAPTMTPPAGVSPPGAYSGGSSGGPSAPPPYSGPTPHSLSAWQNTFQNGYIPENQMVEVHDGEGGMQPMMPLAAATYEAMRRAAAKDGVHLAFTQSYRSYPEQVNAYATKGAYSAARGAGAATPGTSNHGWGLAADMDLSRDPRAASWLAHNAARYGWDKPTTEPWHWEYNGSVMPREVASPSLRRRTIGQVTDNGGNRRRPPPTNTRPTRAMRHRAASSPYS